MNNMKIYIAGPITGHFNYRAKFARAERELQQMGHITINPSFLPDGLKNYMEICYAMIDQADAIYFLEGFEQSVGSLEEEKYAASLNMPMFFQGKITDETEKNTTDNFKKYPDVKNIMESL